jgi:serine/threonine-protein phosphatase 2A regulatory subunit B
VEFDQSGDYLATGDHGGRVVLFERISGRQSCISPHPDQRGFTPAHQGRFEYRYLTEFQSHEPEFDYLKSVEIEEKVNKIRWLRRWDGGEVGSGPHNHSLLSTNDKTIKLWKVFERRITCLADFNLCNGSSNLNRAASLGSNIRGSPDKVASLGGLPMGSPPSTALRVPKVVSTETVLTSKCRRTFAAAHTYHINSISLASDQETFLSADDLRVNLWHLDRPDTSFVVVDIKPPNMEDLTEVITAAEFHPKAAHIFAHASSKGALRLADMRCGALCDHHAKLFEDLGPHGSRSFFADIIASINDVKFVGAEGNHMVTRDYMTLRLWDIRSEASPIAVYPVQEVLRQKLAELYESDAIFDKFDVAVSGDGQGFATGTYSNFFRVIPRATPEGTGSSGDTASRSGATTLLEASRDPTRRRLAVAGGRLGGRLAGFGRTMAPRSRGPSSGVSGEEAVMSDFSLKIQHLSWHPGANVLATASSNSLYIFQGHPSGAW